MPNYTNGLWTLPRKASVPLCQHTGVTLPECSCPSCLRDMFAEAMAAERGVRIIDAGGSIERRHVLDR